MAEKISFLMYNSWQKSINTMPDENAGRLLKRIYAFHVDGEDYPCDGTIEWYVFQTMKGQFFGDIKKYQETCKQKSENAKKGADGARERMLTNNPRKKTSNGMSTTSDGKSTSNDSKQKQAEEEEEEDEDEVEVVEEEAQVVVEEEAQAHGDAPEGAVDPQSVLTSSENEMIDFILERINKEGNQHFTMNNHLREQFWSMYQYTVEDPFDKQEIQHLIHQAWVNVSNYPSLMPYFKPFDIFRKMLWEYTTEVE